jgi:hypothetical protein
LNSKEIKNHGYYSAGFDPFWLILSSSRCSILYGQCKELSRDQIIFKKLKAAKN